MKKQTLYVTPTIEAVDCMVEQGFAQSSSDPSLNKPGFDTQDPNDMGEWK